MKIRYFAWIKDITNKEDEIIKSALLVHDGEILNGAFK